MCTHACLAVMCLLRFLWRPRPISFGYQEAINPRVSMNMWIMDLFFNPVLFNHQSHHRPPLHQQQQPKEQIVNNDLLTRLSAFPHVVDQILSHLKPKHLRTIPCVCKSWNVIMKQVARTANKRRLKSIRKLRKSRQIYGRVSFTLCFKCLFLFTHSWLFCRRTGPSMWNVQSSREKQRSNDNDWPPPRTKTMKILLVLHHTFSVHKYRILFTKQTTEPDLHSHRPIHSRLWCWTTGSILLVDLLLPLAATILMTMMNRWAKRAKLSGSKPRYHLKSGETVCRFVVILFFTRVLLNATVFTLLDWNVIFQLFSEFYFFIQTTIFILEAINSFDF